MNEEKKKKIINKKKIIIRKDDQYEGKSCIDFLISSLKEMKDEIEDIHLKICQNIENQNKFEILTQHDEKLINEEFTKNFKVNKNNKEQIFDILNTINKNHIDKYKKIFKFLNLNLIAGVDKSMNKNIKNKEGIKDINFGKIEKKINVYEEDDIKNLNINDKKEKENKYDIKDDKSNKKNKKINENFNEKYPKCTNKNTDVLSLKDKNKINIINQNKIIQNIKDDDIESEIIINENDDSIFPLNSNESLTNNHENENQNIFLKNTSNNPNKLLEHPNIINSKKESFNNKFKKEIKNINLIYSNKSDNKNFINEYKDGYRMNKENERNLLDSKFKNNKMKIKQHEQKLTKRNNIGNSHSVNLAYTGFEDKDEICTCLIF